MRELHLRVPGALNCHGAVGDVHRRAENLHHFPGSVDDRMRNDVMKADRSVRKNDAMLEIDVAFLAHRCFGNLYERRAIVRVNALFNDLLEGDRCSRLVRKDAKHLVRPEDLACDLVLRPTPGVGESLTLGQVTFCATRPRTPKRDLIRRHPQKEALHPRRKVRARGTGDQQAAGRNREGCDAEVAEQSRIDVARLEVDMHEFQSEHAGQHRTKIVANHLGPRRSPKRRQSHETNQVADARLEKLNVVGNHRVTNERARTDRGSPVRPQHGFATIRRIWRVRYLGMYTNV